MQVMKHISERFNMAFEAQSRCHRIPAVISGHTNRLMSLKIEN